MRSLALALGLVLAASVLAFFVARPVLITPDLAGSVFEVDLPRALAALILMTITYVYSVLDGQRRRLSFSLLPDHMASFDEYTLPWHAMVVYGVLIVYAVSGLGTLLIALIGTVSGIYPTQLIPIVNTLAACVALYRVDTWVGLRSDRRGLLATLLIVGLYSLASAATALLVSLSPGPRGPIWWLTSTVLFLIVALLGWRAGRRARLPAYLHYLLRFIRPGERRAFVDSVYWEARSLVSRAGIAERETLVEPVTKRTAQSAITSEKQLNADCGSGSNPGGERM